MDLVFSDIRVRLALPFDLAYEAHIPDAFSSSPWDPLLLIERFGYLATFVELLFPEEQGGALDRECVQSRA